MSAESLSGLYLHVPFCSAICPYCDFSVLTGGPVRRAGFVARLVEEVRLWAGERWAFDTVYFGGGTPSALAPEELSRILAAVRAAFDVRPEAWIFLEANPEDVTAESVRAWRALGVRTLSLGVQSFDERALAFLGRRHGPEEARRSVELAREAGFDTVSIDLIYGLPGEGPAAWRRTLEEAVRLAPDHLSCYQLTVHEGTPFGFRRDRGELAELPEPVQAELFALTHAFLADSGYPGYEVSNFARAPEHRSRHNRKYWDHTPYLGLGPSAHSFSSTPPPDLPPGGEGPALRARRWWNERKLGPWERRVAAGERPVEGGEELAPADLALEALMLGFRTAEGIDLARFRERYGVDLLKSDEPLVERLVGEGLLRAEGGALAPTLAGLAVADSLARAFDLERGRSGAATA